MATVAQSDAMNGDSQVSRSTTHIAEKIDIKWMTLFLRFRKCGGVLPVPPIVGRSTFATGIDAALCSGPSPLDRLGRYWDSAYAHRAGCRL